MILTYIFDMISIFFLFVASIMIIIILYNYFKGLQVPYFWIYFFVAFLLLMVNNILFVLLPETEFYSMFRVSIKLIINIFIFLGIYELYKRSRKSY